MMAVELKCHTQIETMTFEFPDPKVERLVALTPSDRKWMDDVVRTVEESWTLVRMLLGLPLVAERKSSRRERDRSTSYFTIRNVHVIDDSSFRGSDDDLRARFEEYICAALASIKYAEFLAKGRVQDISVVDIGESGVPIGGRRADLIRRR